MHIAYILPSIAAKGPILVVAELVRQMTLHGHYCEVFYFDRTDANRAISFDCPVKRISMDSPIDFTAYDIVHSHMMRPDKYISRYREYSGAVRYISTLHCYIFSVLTDSYNRLVSSIYGRKWLRWLQAHDRVVVLSKHAKEYYSRWIASSKLSVVYNTRTPDTSLQLDEFERTELLAFRGQDTLIGMNVNLIPLKGIDLIIRALIDLPGYKLFVTGEGTYRKKLTRLAQQCGVANRCYFAGYRPNAYRYLKYYDIYAMPSRSEGFPLALIEAAYYGRPTVVSDIQIFRELLNPTQTAMFSLSDSNTLIDAIRRASNDPSIGANLQTKYRTEWSHEVFYRQYIALYTK